MVFGTGVCQGQMMRSYLGPVAESRTGGFNCLLRCNHFSLRSGKSYPYRRYYHGAGSPPSGLGAASTGTNSKETLAGGSCASVKSRGN